MSEIRLQMTTEQRALADRLAPHFGFRSGVALVFALLANQIGDDQLHAVAGKVGHADVLNLQQAAKALAAGDG